MAIRVCADCLAMCFGGPWAGMVALIPQPADEGGGYWHETIDAVRLVQLLEEWDAGVHSRLEFRGLDNARLDPRPVAVVNGTELCVSHAAIARGGVRR